MSIQPASGLASRPFAALYVKETAVLLGVSLAFPIALHFVPALGGIPWGARLLAMFVAPLLGVVLYRLHVGLLPALLAPALNFMITGMPVAGMVDFVTAELVLFTLVVAWILRNRPRAFYAAPVAFVVALVATAGTALLVPSLAPMPVDGSFLIGSLVSGIPGIALLVVAHRVSEEFRRRGED